MMLLLALCCDLAIETTDETVTVRDDGHIVATYQVAMKQPPESITRPVAGNGFLHPVMTPSGRIVTDDFPVDHPHQHGLFHAWTKTEFRGHVVDYWNTHKKLGRVRHAAIINAKSDGDTATLAVRLEFVDETTTPPVVTMTERRTYTISKQIDPIDAYFIDFESRLEAATDDPVTLKKYLYGGVACRGAAGWSIANGHRFVTADGEDRIALNHRRHHWVASTGPVDGQPATIAMLSHPSNVRSPQHARLHPTMPYFVFSPTVKEPMTVSKSQPLVARYRYIVHDGEPKAAQLTTWWERYAASSGD